MSQQRSRFILVSVCVGVAVLVWLAASRHTPEATSSREALFSDAPAIHVPLETDRGIRQFETRVREDPRDFISLTVLGQLYARKGREKGDLDSFRRAEEAANSAL